MRASAPDDQDSCNGGCSGTVLVTRQWEHIGPSSGGRTRKGEDVGIRAG